MKAGEASIMGVLRAAIVIPRRCILPRAQPVTMGTRREKVEVRVVDVINL